MTKKSGQWNSSRFCSSSIGHSLHIHAVVSEVTIPLFSARSRECACVFMYIVYLYLLCMCSVPLIGVIRYTPGIGKIVPRK